MDEKKERIKEKIMYSGDEVYGDDITSGLNEETRGRRLVMDELDQANEIAKLKLQLDRCNKILQSTMEYTFQNGVDASNKDAMSYLEKVVKENYDILGGTYNRTKYKCVSCGEMFWTLYKQKCVDCYSDSYFR